MRILIIGGTRFIGPHVVAHLHKLGHEIILFHRGKTKIEFPFKVKHIYGNRKNLSDFIEKFKRFSPHIVLDMLPLTKNDASLVVKTFKNIAERIVAISSQDVYLAWGKAIGFETGPTETTPIKEDASLRQKFYLYRRKIKNRYNYEKILVEQAIMNNKEIPGTILRLPMVYGPGDYNHRIFFYLKRMADKRRFILLENDLADWRWTPGYVEDVAKAIVMACANKSAAYSIYNVGQIKALSMYKWIAIIGKIAGWNGKVALVPKNSLPSHLTMNVYASQDFVVDTTKIRAELGYKEDVPLHEGLKKTIAWERENPPFNYDLKEFDYTTEDTILAKLQGEKLSSCRKKEFLKYLKEDKRS